MWRDWTKWQGRLLELGTLGETDDNPYIETTLSLDGELAKSWRRLPPIPLLLEAIYGGRTLRLRYAALCGTHEPAKATYDEGVAMAFDLITQLFALYVATDSIDRRAFTNPHAYVDFNGQARIAFAAPSPRADSRESGFVRSFARMLDEVFAIGRVSMDDPFARLVRDCREGVILDLATIRVALRKLDRESYTAMNATTFQAWRELEQVVGYSVLGRDGMAKQLANQRLGTWPHDSIANAVLDEIVRERAWSWENPHAPKPPKALPREVDLSTLEQTGDYATAIVYLQNKLPRSDEEQLTLARCYQALFDHKSALQHTRAAEPTAARFSLEIEALLALRQTDGLLTAADAWLALAPDEPRAHNARAHALLALGKPAEARAAHDRAAQLGHLPSQFARTNLDRAAKHLRIVAGTEGYRELPVPEHLRELVPLLSQGRLLDAILWLTDRYADPEARALLAACYEYAGDVDSARHIYEQDGNTEAVARCLGERTDDLFV